MHGLNSLLLSEVELEREVAHRPSLLAPRCRAVATPVREGVYLAIPPRVRLPHPLGSWLSPYPAFWIQIAMFPFTSSPVDCAIITINEETGGVCLIGYTPAHPPLLYPSRRITHDDRDGSSEADSNAGLFPPDTQVRPYSAIYNFYIRASSGERVVSLNPVEKVDGEKNARSFDARNILFRQSLSSVAFG